jgi:hypothetical protein
MARERNEQSRSADRNAGRLIARERSDELKIADPCRALWRCLRQCLRCAKCAYYGGKQQPWRRA